MNPVSGVDDAVVTVIVDRTGVPYGNQAGTLNVVSDAAQSPIPVGVFMNVPNPVPLLRVTTPSLTFSPSMTTQTFGIENVGYAPLNWSVSADQPWIQIVPPTSGVDDATVTVNVDPALVPGTGDQFGHISVTSDGGDRDISVTYDRPLMFAGGRIALYADAGFSQCNLDNDAGLVTVYVVHEMAPAVTAVQYKLQNNGHTMVYLADTNLFPLTIGNSQTGVAVSYSSCISSPIHVQNVLYNGLGSTPPCATIDVVPDPSAPSGQIEAVDCSAVKLFPTGASLTIKDDGSCPCTVPVRKRTWGSMRALFMELQKSESGKGD